MSMVDDLGILLACHAFDNQEISHLFMNDLYVGMDDVKQTTKSTICSVIDASVLCALGHTRSRLRSVFLRHVRIHSMDQPTVAVVCGRTGYRTDGPAAFDFPQPHLRHELVVSAHVRRGRSQ